MATTIPTRMTPIGARALVALLLLSLCASARVSRSTNREALHKIQEVAGIPALAYLVLEKGEITDIQAVGLRRATGGLPVTVDDSWHIGSCGKAMTATVLGRLVDKGMLRWGSTLGEVLGNGVHPGLQNATVWNLLSHTAGLPRDPDRSIFTTRPTDVYLAAKQRARIGRLLLRAPPVTAPGTAFQYSNIGYGVAGLVAETVTGKRWDVLLREELFGPLGLNGWGFGAPGVGDPLSQPWGHLVRQNVSVPVPPGPLADILAAAAPIGTMHMPLRAWARFARAHLAGARSGLLSQATFDRLHTPNRFGYAGGWLVGRGFAGNRSTVTWKHDGTNSFWYAFALLLPERDSAVLMATNSGSIDAAYPAFVRTLREIIIPLLGRSKY